MNNLLEYNEFLANCEELNEKNAFRGFGNKLAHRKIKSELKEEIEISNSIMSGIKEGLDSLSENVDEIKKSINTDDIDNGKGEKTKMLDSITKILNQSKKTTWDLNELIDEGEIDYAGFTANVGFSTLLYFGVLLFPIRTRIMVHKGYNYFFTLVKNTIRKSLVMLQLNFDQFENLIITKSFQSQDYLDDMESLSKARDFQEMALKELSRNMSKQKADILSKKFKTIENQFKLQLSAQTKLKQSSNIYACLDQYNNTYTKSLETLRSYAQEDVQKQLDAIKNTMTKLAADDKDYLAYSELIIAAAEEHAYKVSSTIYNKFAKMTEVFSLPNQKKMIDLIQASNQEQLENAKKMKEKQLESDRLKEEETKINSLNDEGAKIFSSLSSASIGKLDDDKKYKNIVGAYNWTYDEFKKLDDDQQDTFVEWLTAHQEVLDKCHDTLKVAVPTVKNDGYFEYIDSLIDYIGPCLKVQYIKESHILPFNDFINETKSTKGRPTTSNDEESQRIRYYIRITSSKEQADEIKKLYYDNHDVAIAALDIIGKKFSNDKFTDNVEIIVDKICDIFKYTNKFTRGSEIHETTYTLLKRLIENVKEARDKDYQELIKNEKREIKK